MNSLREVIAALFHPKFYHGESTAMPSQKGNEVFTRGTSYVGIQNCTISFFFVNPTVLEEITMSFLLFSIIPLCLGHSRHQDCFHGDTSFLVIPYMPLV